MNEIMTLLMGIKQIMPSVTWHQLIVIVPSILTMTGQVTMLNMSRWSEKGGSYRTIQRFYSSQIMWLEVNWYLVRESLRVRGGRYVLVGDETVVTKAEKCTHGVDRFFSSIYEKVVPGLSFFGVAVVSVKEEESTPLLLRFQIEFNFRDAKQFWGLEDFMNVKLTPVYNAANLSLFMTNLSALLLRPRRDDNQDFGLHDLKAEFRGRFYALEALKLLPEIPDPVLIDQLFDRLVSIGAVHL